MRLYDVSASLWPSMHTYPGDVTFHRLETKSLDRGDDLTLSRLDLGSHTGTHVDAPSHFIPGGATLDQLPLDTFMGPAQVVDATGVGDAIDEDEVAHQRPRRGGILLFKTTNSARWRREPHFFEDFVHLTPGAAKVLVRAGLKAVGVDYLSVEGFGAEGAPVHHILLGKPVGIIEGLNLFGVPPGSYRLFCLPLKILGTEGAPARAVLVKP